ncbi:peptidylprolyl isomerase [Bisgaardia hudsonensis]|nr:peptidylprolyl isomerase [Bisgaardia hudsonensis]QLB13887.1 peptidylprolyl isomerase [Bisgaardia hudsonensis]
MTALSLSLIALTVSATNVILHTNYGDIDIQLDEKNAPISSKNFLEYSQSGFYNGTIFHRVIDGFMVQGGGFASGLKKKETNTPIKNEADNGLKNQIGTIAMARTGDPHSATAQFFINVADNDFLNHKDKSSQGWGYAVFGKVVAGMNVVNKIAKVETSSAGFYRDVPKNEIVIQSVSVR